MSFRRDRYLYHYKKRYLGLSEKEKRTLLTQKRIIGHCVRLKRSGVQHRVIDAIAIYTIRAWYRLAVEPEDIEYPKCVRMNRTIASFSPEECDRLFRFKKAELPRLLLECSSNARMGTD